MPQLSIQKPSDLDESASELPSVREHLAGLAVDSDDDYSFVAGFAKELREQRLGLEKQEKSVTGPLNQALKQVRGWFKPITTELKSLEDLCKGKLLDYDRRRAQEREEAMRAAAQAETYEDAHVVLQAAPEAPPKDAGVSFRETWTYKIENPSLVPIEYWSIDHAKLKERMKDRDSNGRPKSVPGVKFFKERKAALR